MDSILFHDRHGDWYHIRAETCGCALVMSGRLMLDRSDLRGIVQSMRGLRREQEVLL